jgi:outer membrane protein OmpA-like peptidoglycan-associated protein
MRTQAYRVASAALAVLLASASAAVAQGGAMPTVRIESTTVSLGIGGQTGHGTLMLPNLGKGCAYPFTVKGFGAGLKVGISKLTATGAVRHLRRVADIAGRYVAGQAESTLVVGGGVLNLKNRSNNVVMELKSSTEGVNLGFGAEGMTIALKKFPLDGPRSSIVYFGYNKDWVSEKSKAALAAFVHAWKCRYVHVNVVGHTDTSGKEGYNVELSGKRASAVRDYLIKAGFAPGRITTRAAGEHEPLLPSGKNERIRANRAVVLTVR